MNSTTGAIGWPNQALEPIYIWANAAGPAPGWGGASYSNDTGGRVAAERDYYPQASGAQVSPTAPFDGTAGTGWGTLANRPPTCAPGVAYFAVDQGSWNTSASNPYGAQQNGADGELYACTATDTWTLSYTPYTYPHPLTGGGTAGAGGDGGGAGAGGAEGGAAGSSTGGKDAPVEAADDGGCGCTTPGGRAPVRLAPLLSTLALAISTRLQTRSTSARRRPCTRQWSPRHGRASGCDRAGRRPRAVGDNAAEPVALPPRAIRYRP